MCRRSRDWGDAAQPRNVGPPGAGRGGKEPPLELLDRAQPCPHLDASVLASRTVSEQMLLFQSPSVWQLFLAARETSPAMKRAVVWPHQSWEPMLG